MSKFNFKTVQRNFLQMKRDLPKVIANDALRFFLDSFTKQGWDDGGLKKWKKRKVNKGKNRAILVKSGRLRRDVRRSQTSATFNLIKFVVDNPYAHVHNNGYNGPVAAHERRSYLKSKVSENLGLRRSKSGKLVERRRTATIFVQGASRTVKAHTRNVPMRRFMGDSKTLRKLQREKIKIAMRKIWA